MIAFEQLPLFRLGPEKPPQSPPRHIQLGTQIVGYTLSQARRRRLSLNIDERGLRVAAPMSMRIGQIEDFIRSHEAWVLEKLAEFATAYAPRQLRIHAGARLPLLAGEITIEVQPGTNRVRWVGDTLLLQARPGAMLDTLARRGLQQRALEVFNERVALYAEKMDVTPPPLALSSARTRWGSCSQTGIRLNWRLIHLPLHLVDYVVAHELAHLIEMNHSPRFWAEVGKLYPDWKAARDELKRSGNTVPLV